MTDENKNSELLLEKEILAPFTYLRSNDKRLNVKYISALNYWLQVPMEKLNPVMDICHMLYVSCQLCDDVQDSTKVRGVVPAAHWVYGMPLTINASVHSLLLVLEKTMSISPEACEVIIKEHLELYRGQGVEVYWRDNFKCPTENQYREMSKGKTGRLFMAVYRLMQLFSENKTDYSKLILTLGSYFQILDDYYGLKHKEDWQGWSKEDNEKVDHDTRFCEDITEGKFSFPVVHAMQTEYADQIINILRQRTRDMNLKKYFVSLLEKSGSLQYTRDAMEECDREIRAEVARLGGNPILEEVLDLHLIEHK